MPIDPSIPLGVRPPQPINPLADFAQVMQLKQAQALLPLKIQEAQQNAQKNALELQEAQRTVADRKALDDAYAGSVTNDSDTGLPTFDRSKLSDALIKAGQGHQIPVLMKTLDDSAEAHTKLQKAQADLQQIHVENGAAIGAGAAATGYDPAFFRSRLTIGAANGSLEPKNVQPIIQELDQAQQQDPTGAAGKAIVQKYSQSLMDQSEKMMTAQSRKQTAVAAAAKVPGELEAQNNKRILDEQKITGTEPIQPVDKARQAFEQQRIDRELNASLETARHNRADEAETRHYHALSVEGVELTDQAKDKMAEMFSTTGVLPNLGMGKAAAANRSDIINRAAKNFPNVDFATNKSVYQALTGSLKNLQKQSDQTDAFENTAGKNIDIFLKAAGKIVDTGSPLLNRPARAIADSLGSTNMAAFKAARETALTEAAKVLESPQGGGALTVSGREAVKTLSDPSATLGQQVAAMKALRADMANRKQSNAEQIKAITDRIGQNNTNAAPQGKIIVSAPDGSTHPFDTQAQADAFKKLAHIQ